MSFGIAKIIDGKIRIYVDSLMSGDDLVRHDLQKHSLLKAVLVNHQLCIVFAGKISIAEDLLEKVHAVKTFTLNQLISFMLDHHNNNRQETEYIVASTIGNRPILIEIKNGKVYTNTLSSWVGSKSAFSSFQEHFEKCKFENRALADAFGSAFSRVMNDDIPDVGGFKLSLTQYQDKNIYGKPLLMNYDNFMSMYAQMDEDFKKKHGFWNTSMATRASGAFAYSTLLSITLKYPGVAIYFGHAKLGLLFSYRKFGELVPKQYKNFSSLEFAKEVAKIGITLKGNAYEGNGYVQIL